MSAIRKTIRELFRVDESERDRELAELLADLLNVIDGGGNDEDVREAAEAFAVAYMGPTGEVAS